jgi:ribosomal protein S18 acetylase RimI-like enzyme
VRTPAVFANFLRLTSMVFFAAGAMHLTMGLGADALLGANVSAQTLTDAGLDSQNRFYGVSFMLYGVLLIIVASDMQRYAVILKSTMWVLCAAGLARLIPVWLYGWPPVLIGLLLIGELTVPPLVLLWFAKLQHCMRAGSNREFAALTMPNFNIRPFEAADLPAMQQVRQAAFKPVFQSFRDIVGEEIYALALAESDAEQAQLLDRLCEPGSPHQIFVATINNEIVGFVSFSLHAEKRIGEIGLNAVLPDHAGQGVGTSMYEFAMARMKESGMALATVSTGGDPSHLPARRAYQKAGFGPALPSVFLYKVL